MHGELVAAVNGDGGGEDETAHTPGVHRGVDQVYAADQIIVVVEALDEMAETLGGVGGQVENVLEAMLREQAVHQGLVHNTAFDTFRPGIHVFGETSAEIVQHHHLPSCSNQVVHHVGSDEPGATGYQYFRHQDFL